jgi:ComF family protein
MSLDLGGVFRSTSPEDTSEAVSGFRSTPREERIKPEVVSSLLSVLLAPACLACATPLDRPLDGPVCPACWNAIPPLSPPLCDVCGDVLSTWRVLDRVAGTCARCRRHRLPITRLRAAGAYDGVLRQVLHSLKYEGRRTLAVPLGGLMRERGADALLGADIVVPVPLHWRRAQARGFNQADDLAATLGLPLVRALRRVRPTSPQYGLTTVARLRNVRGAFAPPRRALIFGRRHDPRLVDACVVLVDDVCTTGATLQSCAEVLLEGGAREVRALTAARALSRQR